MKQAALLCLLCLALPAALRADWQWQNPLPQGNSLHDVIMTDGSTGYAVGDCGTILKTEDGGQTWISEPSLTETALWRLASVDDEHVWAVGFGGTILFRNASGAWLPQASGCTRDLRGVHFADALHGWAVGDTGTALLTTDGGQTWSGGDSLLVHTGTGTYLLLDDLLGVQFITTQVGWAVGGHNQSNPAILLKTTDGGESWYAQDLGYNGWMMDIAFTDATHGFAVGRMTGDILMLRTSDGATWEAIAQTDVPNALRSIAFSDPQNGYAVGANGMLLSTADGGQTWTYTALDPNLRLDGVAASASALCAVGETGAIFRAADAASPWLHVDHGARSAFIDLAFANAQVGYALAETRGALRTTNGGAEWLPDTTDAGIYFSDVSFIDATIGWKVGGAGRIMQTTDGGATWVTRHMGEEEWNAVRFADALHGWVAGDNGYILHTTNGGAAWTAQSNGTSTYITAIWAADTNHAVTVGGGGTIFTTSDGGTNWVPRTSGTAEYLLDLTFASASEGWAVGGYGTVLHTADGGETWELQASGVTDAGLSAVVFTSAGTGWVVGWWGTVLHSVDGGESWEQEFVPLNGSVIGLAANAAGDVWICGDFGAILYKNTPIVPATPPFILPPSSFILSAFPNPFNPTTTLAFTLPSAGKVTLAVYNLTGRLVTTLAEQSLAAGSQTFTLDAAAWPSGIYFARLQTPSGSLTHKLVLLK